MKRRVVLTLLVSLLVLAGLAASPASQAAAQDATLIHIVARGETVFSIGRLYGVSPQAIVQANHLANANVIYAGQRLVIPRPAGETIHVVARGETLNAIATRYGVTVLGIMNRNGITDPNRIFAGQRLIIPGTGSTPGVPAMQEAIIITSPGPNADVRSPVTITGFGSGFEQTLGVHILDQSGTVIGQGSVSITAQPGQIGPCTGTVTFTAPASRQIGRIQVFSASPRDGAFEHLNSVAVYLVP
jgi:LysM repeat protein